MNCPHCGKEMSAIVVAKAIEGSSLTLKLQMEEGHMLDARTLGETIADMGRLLSANARACGARDMVYLIQSLETAGSSLSIRFVLARRDRDMDARNPGS